MPHDQVTPDALELRHLRAFVAVAEELNFGRAAARLFVSQSSLSRQIAALERMLGCVLLHRSTHHVALTPAGVTLFERTPRILADLDDLVARTRAVGGELAARIRALGEPFRKLTFADADTDALRAAAEHHHAHLPLPDGVTYHPVVAGGVPALVATPPGGGPAPVATQPGGGPARIVLVHGGTYVNGSAYGYRSLAGAVAVATGSGVLVPDYRLAPEHPYPAAVLDVEAAYTWLAGRTHPADVVIVGDAVGAGIALCALLRVRDRGGPLPGRCVLFTPWVDVEAVADLPDEPAPSATRAGALLGTARYVAGHPLDAPDLNPLHADLSGLPPTLIQAAAGYHAMADAERLARRLREHGVDTRMDVYPGSVESFQLYWSFLPDAADALRDLGAHLRRPTG